MTTTQTPPTTLPVLTPRGARIPVVGTLAFHDALGFCTVTARTQSYLRITVDDIDGADDVVLITEARDIIHGLDSWAKVEHEPLKEVIIPWTPEKARVEFMKLYSKLILLSFPIGVCSD